jgi:hypothetical protein
MLVLVRNLSVSLLQLACLAVISLGAPLWPHVARTVLAGFCNSSGNPAVDLADFDNFAVATAPEPDAFAGIALLLGAVCVKELAQRIAAAEYHGE